MIHSGKLLVNSPERDSGDLLVAAGIHTFAIEEYGKLSYLLGLRSAGGRIDIEYAKIFRSHKAKFGIASNKLPAECLLLKGGAFSSGFNSKTFDVGAEASFESRLRIFYTDPAWSTDFGYVPGPDVDAPDLMKAMTKLEEIVTETEVPSTSQ